MTTILPVVVNCAPLLRIGENTLDLTLPSATTTTAASSHAENEAFYEHVKESYIQEGCLSTLGPFPSAEDVEQDSTTISTSSRRAPRPPARQRRTASMNGTTGMPCKCGMLHDLGASAIGDYSKEDEVVVIVEQKMGTSSSSYSSLSSSSLSSSTTTTTIKQSASTIANTQNSESKCVNGLAEGTSFPCNNVDLIAHLPLNLFEATNTDATPITANDVWGWTSSDDREFVIWGVEEGHYFLEVTSDDPTLLGFLPSNTDVSVWHDVKVIGDFAYMGSEAGNHGLQIFDLTQLLEINPTTDCVTVKYCKELEATVVYTGTNDVKVRNTHNVVANPDSDFMYLVGGSNGCSSGLHIVDVSNPLIPKFVACFGDDGYVHDAQCVIYKGPDPNYQNNNEICFCFNEDTVTIVDVTDKSNINIISKTSYENDGYTHQGWLSTDQRHVVFGDETDELNYAGFDVKTRTLILQIEDLANPTNFQEYFGTTSAIDHNLYILPATAPGQDYDGVVYEDTDLIYQANYQAGLRIQQVLDYDTGTFEEVGFFDTYPNSDGTQFNGAWSVYPFFASGLVVVSTVREGLFLVRPDLTDSLVAEFSQAPTGTAAPTPAPFSCPNDGDNNYRFQLKLGIDLYGFETSWTLSETDSESLVAEGLKESYGGDEQYVEPSSDEWYCLKQDTCYTFEIRDGYGDGICCNYGYGYFRGYVNELEVFGGGEFEAFQTKSFCTDAIAGPTPTKPPTETPSSSPIKAPTGSPSAFPTEDDGAVVCVDSDDLKYKGNKGCDWVGKGKGQYRIKRIQKKCKRKHLGIKIFEYCLETCGKVGKGKCQGNYGF